MYEVICGSSDHAGAIVIYKSDDSVQDAVCAAKATSSASAKPYVAVARTPDDLQSVLREWQDRTDSDRCLCVYAHMGVNGLAPNGGGNEVTWRKLAEWLCEGVDVLWLLGCSSTCARGQWPAGGPVRRVLLCTSDSAYYAKGIEAFALEITTKSVTRFDEMPAKLRDCYPGLNKATEYWWSPNAVPARCGWVRIEDKQGNGRA